MRNPTWSFYGADFPSKEKLLEERNHVFAKHPRTNFVALHVANWPENLDAVSAWLRKYPNMSVEFGAREAELGRQPRRARQFFMEFQDRIMFGTDSEPDPKMYANYFRWLETADEYFEYWGYPGQGRWEIYGMELPDEVLEKVYHKNAERIFAQFKGMPARRWTDDEFSLVSAQTICEGRQIVLCVVLLTSGVLLLHISSCNRESAKQAKEGTPAQISALNVHAEADGIHVANFRG